MSSKDAHMEDCYPFFCSTSLLTVLNNDGIYAHNSMITHINQEKWEKKQKIFSPKQNLNGS